MCIVVHRFECGKIFQVAVIVVAGKTRFVVIFYTTSFLLKIPPLIMDIIALDLVCGGGCSKKKRVRKAEKWHSNWVCIKNASK
jgi:hypothetical protein